VEVYEQVFEPSVVHVYIAGETVPELRTKLDSLIGDEAYLEDLRQRSAALSQKFIFDGFFNKLIERFTGEYAL